jgi:hypothetical protein
MANSSVILSPVCSAVLSNKNVPPLDLFKATQEQIHSAVEDEPWPIATLQFGATCRALIVFSLKNYCSIIS